MGYGMKGFLGLGKESTFGTAVSVTDYAEIMSESIQAQQDRFDYKNAINALWEPSDAAGVLRVGGAVNMMGHPVTLGHLIKAAMNTLSSSVVLSGYLWTIRGVSPQAEFADGVPAQPYTLEVFRDVTSSNQYSGMICNKLNLSVTPNQELRAAAEWIGKGQALIQATSPTFPGSPAEPFGFNTASISLGGSATARIEAFNLSIDNQLEGIPALNNSAEIARIRRRGPQLIRVSGTLDFIDQTEYLDFINQTERALVVNVFKSQSFSFAMDIPRMVYTAAPANIGGRGRITMNFEGRARFLVASNTALDLRLTTVKSNY